MLVAVLTSSTYDTPRQLSSLRAQCAAGEGISTSFQAAWPNCGRLAGTSKGGYRPQAARWDSMCQGYCATALGMAVPWYRTTFAGCLGVVSFKNAA